MHTRTITIKVTATISRPPPNPAPTYRNPDCSDCSLPPDTAVSSDVTAIKESLYAELYLMNRMLALLEINSLALG